MAHLVLCSRTGGYHARMDAGLVGVEADFESLRGGQQGMPSFWESVGTLEAAGILERAANSIALHRVSGHSYTTLDLQALVPLLSDTATPKLLHRIRHQTESGVGSLRYRELARYGRLAAQVSLHPGSGAGDPLFEASAGSMPSAGPVGLPSDAGLMPGRSLLGNAHVALPEHEEHDVPILATGAEVGALVLGDGRGANAVRRAIRAATVWLLCVEATRGRVGDVHKTMVGLSKQAAAVLGMNPSADHRSRVRDLLVALEAVGALSRSSAGLRVLHPPAARQRDVQRFLADWGSLLFGTYADSDGISALSESHLHRYVHPAWRQLLEQRRLNLRVLSGAAAGSRRPPRADLRVY